MKIVEMSELSGLIGTVIGTSDWIVVDQDRINVFADVTEDHQFIHIDPVKAKDSPFGGTIAHGFLTLSLMSKFAETGTLVIKGAVMGINYGLESVRFLNPVASGSNVRGVFTLKGAFEKKPGQILLTYGVSVEIEGAEKPALVADWLVIQILEEP
ncbi:MAG: MaoC family dehydratase [Maricaulaceae bacterium]